MSEEALRRFLERLNGDASFRESAQQDPGGALAEFDLSPSEQAALSYSDEDALRRLSGMDVSPFLAEGGPAAGHGKTSGPICWWGTLVCYTPGSGQGCGSSDVPANCPKKIE